MKHVEFLRQGHMAFRQKPPSLSARLFCRVDGELCDRSSRRLNHCAAGLLGAGLEHLDGEGISIYRPAMYWSVYVVLWDFVCAAARPVWRTFVLRWW